MKLAKAVDDTGCGQVFVVGCTCSPCMGCVCSGKDGCGSCGHLNVCGKFPFLPGN